MRAGNGPENNRLFVDSRTFHRLYVKNGVRRGRWQCAHRRRVENRSRGQIYERTGKECGMPGKAARTHWRVTVIKVENLSKAFGAKLAVDDVSFTVERGEVLGFL